ncbi:MAG: NPCBM/NEW2 domain-containing protein [Pirellulales bacterium]
MGCFLEAFIAAALLAVVPVEVETLDGSTETGRLTVLSAKGVALDTDAGPRHVPIDRLLGVRMLAYAAPNTDAASPVRIELVDGSVLSVSEYLVSMGIATMTLPGGAVIELPVRAVSVVRFGESENVAEQQWQEILRVGTTGDLLVIRKGDVIDFLEGVIEEVEPKSVAFQFDGQRVNVPRRKVSGFVYYQATRQDPVEPVCQAIGSGATRLALTRVTLDDGQFHLVTTGGQQITVPANLIAEFDFSMEKLCYLSDLEPAKEEWTPFYRLRQAEHLTRSIGALRRDRAIEGGPLRLGGKTYTRGLAMRSRGEVVYRLRGEYREFSAIAGIDDRMGDRGHVRLVIHGDGRNLFEQAIRGGDVPLPLRIDIQGVDRLTLLVDYGEDTDVADHFDLVEARISK